jgi:hypothetical protein
MHGHVYQCFNEGTGQNQFTKTTEILGEYIYKNLTSPGDLECLTRDLTTPVVPGPEELLDTKTSNLKKEIWKRKVDKYVGHCENLEHNLKAVYKVIWVQCSESMKSKLKCDMDFIIQDKASDCVWLLKTIKGIMLNVKI